MQTRLLLIKSFVMATLIVAGVVIANAALSRAVGIDMTSASGYGTAVLSLAYGYASWDRLDRQASKDETERIGRALHVHTNDQKEIQR